MDEHLQRETENLAKSWMQHDAQMLREYLIAGVEDPRINIQSILTRHCLIVALFGNRFERLMEHELRFALVMNWARTVWDEVGSRHDLQAIRHALRIGADDAEGISVPPFIASTFATLSENTASLALPNYIETLLELEMSAGAQLWPPQAVLSTFQRLWHMTLDREQPTSVSVLELACGSANDYRFIHDFGLASLIDYTGLDLCEKNVENAQAMFPHARFAVGNALAMDAPDNAFDYCIVQDLFEHLSPDALEHALKEICRVARTGLCLGFFNLHEGEDHIVQPVDDYHWNTLSVPRLVADLHRHGFKVQIVHIDTFLKWRFNCSQTHNKRAYTFLAERW